MPIIKSAKKRDRQNKKRRVRNKEVKMRMLTLVKNIQSTAKTDVKKAEEFIPSVYSSIDTAVKKNIIHKNTGARKKSLVSRCVKKAKGEVKK